MARGLERKLQQDREGATRGCSLRKVIRMGHEGKAAILDKMGVKGRVPGSHGRLVFWKSPCFGDGRRMGMSQNWWPESWSLACQPSQSKKPGGSGKGASGDGGPR